MNTLDVTLLAISSIEIPSTIQALEISRKKLDFGYVKLITDQYVKTPMGITLEYCPKINTILDYNNYVFKNLGDHVSTSHCILVQYHAYILRPWLWDDTWLEYDYIGAPWELRNNSYIANTGEIVRVGNGGFSLRSKKLLDLPKKLGLDLKEEQGFYNEDGNICCYYRKEFLENGIKYAPLDVAVKFSYENPVPENENILPFGFHRSKK